MTQEKNIGLLKILFGLLVTSIISGCEKQLPFNEEIKAPKITLNASFMPDSTWKVYLNRSLSVIDSGELSPIENAEVSVLGSNGSAFTLSYNPSKRYYSSNITVEPNVAYSITASAPNFNTVFAKNTAPSPVEILNVDTLSRLGQFERVRVFRINFNDPPDAENFYLVKIVEIVNSTFTNWQGETIANIQTRPIFISSNDVSADQRDEFHEYLTFSDELFNGQNKTFVCESSSYYSMFGNNITISYQVEIRNISREMYNFRRSILLYSMVDGNPFAEPVRVFTNIENGFGIFGGEAPFRFNL
jgi:hypothetical protein